MPLDEAGDEQGRHRLGVGAEVDQIVAGDGDGRARLADTDAAEGGEAAMVDDRTEQGRDVAVSGEDRLEGDCEVVRRAGGERGRAA